jgi:hypothetical protein
LVRGGVQRELYLLIGNCGVLSVPLRVLDDLLDINT